MLLRVIWCQVLNIIREESSPSFPGQFLSGLDPCYCKRIKKWFSQYLTEISIIITHALFFCIFQRSLAPPFLLSAFPYTSSASSPLSFWWSSSGLVLLCQHLSCVGSPKLDIFLQMKPHKHQHGGHCHFTWMTANNLVIEVSLHCFISTELTQAAHCCPSSKITQGQSFKCQGLIFRMSLPSSLDMAE